ncbi:hypothetical protein [Ruminococcus sp. FC2018]|uniref:hypothetical protein n=1 Tax=Ruminococcus sp. FC2018 TaxID=1410617 RepID=UPI00048B4528|nr:hypothetical protein [Ruminococcus sp. FC2018]
MCDVICNILIGLLSGIVSSGIVTIAYDKKTKKIEHERNFNADKQVYHRYILSIRNELFFAYKNNDYENLIRTIENEPIRDSFTNLDDESHKSIGEISNFISQMKERILSTGYSMKEKDYKIYNGKLFQYSVHALKLEEVKENGKTDK